MSQFAQQHVNQLEQKIKKLETQSQEELSSKKETILVEFDSLLQSIHAALSSGRFPPDSFLYQLLHQQLKCITIDRVNGFRWEKPMIHWAMTLQYYGGAQVLNILRGECEHKGDLVNNIYHHNLYLPSISTIKRYIPTVTPYQPLSNTTVKQIKSMLQQKNKQLVGGIVFDEIEIRGGLTYLKSTGIN
jgi:hypothetical protein